MRQFIPPTESTQGNDFFWGRFLLEAGVSLVKVGGHFQKMPYPWMGDLAGLTDGVDYFLGGHIYQISDEVATQLIADGFLSGDPPPGTDNSFGSGPFGSGPFGG